MGLSALPGHAKRPLGLFLLPIRVIRKIRGFPAIFREFHSFRPSFGPFGLSGTPDVGFLRFQDHWGIYAADFFAVNMPISPLKPMFAYPVILAIYRRPR